MTNFRSRKVQRTPQDTINQPLTLQVKNPESYWKQNLRNQAELRDMKQIVIIILYSIYSAGWLHRILILSPFSPTVRSHLQRGLIWRWLNVGGSNDNAGESVLLCWISVKITLMYFASVWMNILMRIRKHALDSCAVC